MKRLLCIVVICFTLCGCGKQNRQLSQVLQLRSQLQNANGCEFSANITADYKTQRYTFSLDCKWEPNGKLLFRVTQPEWIADITGSIEETGGKLTFDDKMLAFDTLADGLVSPVTCPWLMMKTICGGYIQAVGQDGEYIHAIINDSYKEQPLTLDFWFKQDLTPVHCEVLWQGTRVLSLDVEDFHIL